MKAGLRAVLFDLDGTLIDSAPDLAGAANDLRVARGLAPLPYASLRPMVGAGARGMVGVAFGIAPGHEQFGTLRDEFLQRYAERLLQLTVVFADMIPVLTRLDEVGAKWGIVTNKARVYAEPIASALGLMDMSSVLIYGDTTAHTKPHPAPLHEAARRLGVPEHACVYVGDDHRDIVAGRAAGMLTVAAGWGYLGQGEAISDWGADAVLADPAELLQWLELT